MNFLIFEKGVIKERSAYILHVFAIIVLLSAKCCDAGIFSSKVAKNDKTSRVYTNEAKMFRQNMDLSVNPCVHFYNFTCGGYMKQSTDSGAVSPGYDRYKKLMNEIQDILESERDIPGTDVSVARNIYTRCKKIKFDELGKRKLIDNIAMKIGLISDMHKIENGTVRYEWNEKIDWIDSVHKLREMGLNFRFLLGLYVSPRSQSDKRNILEVRKPILQSDHNSIHLLKEENLKIVNAGEYFKSLNGSFPLQKLINGFFPKDINVSLKDEIRVDEAYIKTLVNTLKTASAICLAKKLYSKLESEIERLLPSTASNNSNREKVCMQNAIYYDYNFQVAVSKTFFTEKKKDFATEIINNVIKTTKMLITISASFDKESRIKSIRKLSDLQLMIAYANNTIKTSTLNWKNVNYQKYVKNILTLSKYQMDAKFRQLNLVNDVREWEFFMIPSTYNAAYFPRSHSLYMPALYLTSEMHKLDLPSYIHYGSVGYTMGHELGHVIDKSTNENRLVQNEKNFAKSRVQECNECLRNAFYELTGKYKKKEMEDFADLAGYKIAYYSFLEFEKKNGYDNSLPGLKYNSKQMFWITSASSWCSKNAFAMQKDNLHSPNYARVLIPLSNLPEFAQDFNCSIGSPMNPTNKCKFL